MNQRLCLSGRARSPRANASRANASLANALSANASQANAPRRGAALLTTLVTVALLASVTAIASHTARASARSAAAVRATTVARTMAESGVLAARARLEQRLRSAADTASRLAVWDALEKTGPLAADTILDGVFAAVPVNVSSRLDVNMAGADGLAALFRTVTTPQEAARVAALLDARVRGAGRAPSVRDSVSARDSLVSALLGRSAPPSRGVDPFESLDDVQEFLGPAAPWMTGIAEFLTVDGDGYVDRRHAAPAVLRAAAGSLLDAPTRVLLVSRGWAVGERATHEIQAVYAVEGTELRLVRWREQSR